MVATSTILYESASGYALFTIPEASQKPILKSFIPFKSAAHALENINDISEGIVNEFLALFLQHSVTKGVKLGVGDRNLAGAIKVLGIDVDSSEEVLNSIRNIRASDDKLFEQSLHDEADLSRAQLGLGHAYSRGKVKFNVNRADNMIIQAIALLDTLDKDTNTFAMRVREWYGWHFPELIKFVKDNYVYASLALWIGNKSRLTDDDEGELQSELERRGGDQELARPIIQAAKISMGQDLAESDMENIALFAQKCISLVEYKMSLSQYLTSKMNVVAPNLSELIGTTVGARLISKAGSLSNLSKYPASTVQILGAEKALFRALKTKSNTPKYGLIYHSTFIGRAGPKNKGRISRFLANKCSIASRIDNFTDTPTTKFGEVLKRQVEERLKFYEGGVKPTRNEAAMKEALDAIVGDLADDIANEVEEAKKSKKSKKDKKRKLADDDEIMDDESIDEDVARQAKKLAKKQKKEEKKSKKNKVTEAIGDAPVASETKLDSMNIDSQSPSKKEKKKDKKEKKKDKKKDKK